MYMYRFIIYVGSRVQRALQHKLMRRARRCVRGGGVRSCIARQAALKCGNMCWSCFCMPPSYCTVMD